MLRNEDYIHKAPLFIVNAGEMDEHVKKYDVPDPYALRSLSCKEGCPLTTFGTYCTTCNETCEKHENRDIAHQALTFIACEK